MLEKIYNDYLDEALASKNKNFLDNNEIRFIENLINRAFCLFYREKKWNLFNLTNGISEYINSMKKGFIPTNPYDTSLFYIFLFLFSRCEIFSEIESIILKKIILRYLNYANNIQHFQTPPASEQEKNSNVYNLSDDFKIEQLKMLRDFLSLDKKEYERELSKITSVSSKKHIDNMRKAYLCGSSLLNIPKSIQLLKDLKKSTEIDPEHYEYFSTGTYTGSFYKSSNIQRGTTYSNGLKTTDPIYNNSENIIFHSHPSTSPLSLNMGKTGDLGHAYKGKKQVVVINKEGDIFYTNYDLSKSCFEILNGCEDIAGQVYLGNIKDY